jgi:hypothetical protein
VEIVEDNAHDVEEKEATSCVKETEKGSENVPTQQCSVSELIPSVEVIGDSSHHLNEEETSNRVKDTEHQLSLDDSFEETIGKSSRPLSKKKKNVKSGDSKSKSKIKEKSLPTPLTDFERAIMEPKKRHKKLKRKLSAAESERDVGTLTGGDHSKSVPSSGSDLHQKVKSESKSKSGKESVVPQSKIVQKILRDKAREEEMEDKNLVPKTDQALLSFEEILKPKQTVFKIPKTTAPEADTSVEWKSPLQDVGHVKKFSFGEKQNKTTHEPKPVVSYSMGMAGSSTESADSVPSSKKAGLKNQYLQDLYNAIVGGFQNPSTTEKIPDPSSLKNSQLEEPSTSTGIKRAADVYATSAAKKARLDSKEEDMTPDSTTPDKYLEQGSSETDSSEMGATATQEAVPSICSHLSAVSSNVSSTEESGILSFYFEFFCNKTALIL